MISFFPMSRAPEAEPEQEELSIEAMRARIVSLDPQLPRDSATWDAALILLSAAHIGQNVDRLARFTGLPREQVARSARRLVDNGVWREGNTACRWLDEPQDAPSFWSDVAVAEGRLCRRLGEDGEPEWAPPGYWRKHYEYVGPRGEEQPSVVCYHPHVEPLSQDLPRPDDVSEEDEDEGPSHGGDAVADTTAAHIDMEPVATGAPEWLGGGSGPEPVDETWTSKAGAGTAQLFPDALWLG